MHVRGHIEVQAGAYCKTVGSAYVGSNPTPATTSENGPLAAETRPAGRFLLVAACISACHWGSMRGSGYGYMADGVRAERAVRIIARFADLRPFCTVAWAPGSSPDWPTRIPAGRSAGLAGARADQRRPGAAHPAGNRDPAGRSHQRSPRRHLPIRAGHLSRHAVEDRRRRSNAEMSC